MGLLTKAAARFVAGETIEEAVAAIKKLNEKGIAVTFDHLGEDVDTKEKAIEGAAEYVRIIEAIDKNKLNSNVSIKLTQMGLGLGADFCVENVTTILEAAKKYGNFVRIDMEGSDVTQVTLDVFYKLYAKYPQNVGIVIQAYLYRSEKDIEELIKNKATMRLCKGAYKEPKEVAYQKEEVIANYMKLAKKILKSGQYHGIATHDFGIIEEVKKFVKEEKIPNSQFEFQMLYGIEREAQEKLVKEGYNMRVYVPYGTEWMPYTIRRMKERKENVWFVVKHFFGG